MSQTANSATLPEQPSASMVEQAAAWFIRLRDKEVGDQDKSAFAAWLAEHPLHQLAYQRMESMGATFHKLESRPALHALEQSLTPEFKPVRKLSAKALALSLSGMVAVGLGLQTETANYWMADYRTAVGEQRVIELPDHSRITLNTHSAIDLDYSAHARRITLRQGEVLVEVAPDKSRPFIIANRDGTARALGTQYLVRQLADATQVAVVESTVEACTTPRALLNAAPSCVTLQAGQSTWLQHKQKLEVKAVDVDALTSWSSGRLAADNLTLVEVLQELERYRPGHMMYDPQALGDLRVSGLLPLSDPDRALEMLANYLPVEIKHYTPWLVVVQAQEQKPSATPNPQP